MDKKDLDFITQPKTKNVETGELETGFLINLIDSSGLGSTRKEYLPPTAILPSPIES